MTGDKDSAVLPTSCRFHAGSSHADDVGNTPDKPSRIPAIAADIVLIFHAAFALFAVCGALLVYYNGWFAVMHVPVVAWSSIVNLMRWTCPLTPLEKNLRARAGQLPYEGGWIQHYLEPMVRPLGMPRRLELVAGVSILVWNLCLYGIIGWTRNG